MNPDLYLSQRIQRIQVSSTMALINKSKTLKEQGVHVINFGAGEPDFDTPQNIKEAAIKAIQRGETKYTPVSGTLGLKKAIQAKLKRDQNLDYNLDEISAACGAKNSLYNIFQVLLNKNDEVIVPSPYWVSYPDQIKLADGVPVFVTTLEEEGFCLTPEALSKAITPKTKALILNTPNNPTGAAYSRKNLEALVDVCLENKIFIISDEIYEKLIYDDFEFVSPASLSAKAKEITFIVNGVSKAYAMTGWRMGYTAGPRWLVSAIDKLQGQSLSNICSITQAACIEALNGPQESLALMKAAFDERRHLLVDGLNRMGLSCLLPKGAFYVLVNIKSFLGKKMPQGQTIESCVDLSNYLLDSAHVAVVAGVGFGAPGYIRLSYTTHNEAIQEGLNRIQNALQNLMKKATLT